MQAYKKILFLIVVMVFMLNAERNFAQSKQGKFDTIRVEVTKTEEGEKVPTGDLEPIFLYIRASPRIRKMYEEWTRLRNAVYATYPYATAASRVFDEINRQLYGVRDNRKRKAIIKSHEKELRAEFTSKLKDLSIYQGKILMKLIYRQTGNSCYEIINEYKGDLSAVVYQGVARIFGSSLKQTYDPNGEDKSIEILVHQAQTYYGY